MDEGYDFTKTESWVPALVCLVAFVVGVMLLVVLS